MTDQKMKAEALQIALDAAAEHIVTTSPILVEGAQAAADAKRILDTIIAKAKKEVGV